LTKSSGTISTEFAAVIKVDERTVRRWLSAKTQPTQEELDRVERAFFGVDKYSDWRYELRRSFDDVSWWPHALDNTTRDRTQRIFEQLQGWWEVFHYGFSQQQPARGQASPLLSLTLLNVRSVNRRDPRLMDCVWTDLNLERNKLRADGRVINFNQTLYFFREWENGNGIAVFCAREPHGDTKVIYGIAACFSGWGMEHSQTPSAARFAFRRLARPGWSWDEICERCALDLRKLVPADVRDPETRREALERYVGDYIDPRKFGTGDLNGNPKVVEELREIADKIRNHVPDDQIPFVLRAPP
jgi:hypothetical protein